MQELKGTKAKLLILLSIFFVSLSLFTYQVILTRIYSAVLWYHYVFLITSFAICGLGIGSIIAFYKGKKHKSTLQGLWNIPLILAVLYVLVITAVYFLPFMNNVLVYTILGTLPFVAGGFFISTIFREYPGINNKLYFADLIGSGAGSIVVLFLLNYMGMYRTVITICVLTLLSALCLSLSLGRKRILSCIVFFVFASGILLPAKYVDSLEKSFIALKSNPNKTFGSYVKGGKKPEILYTDWNAFSRTDVIQAQEIPDYMTVTIDGAANAPMLKYDGNHETLEKLKKSAEFLPFTLGNNNKTLIIGSGGGRDILYALAGGSQDISAVEINTSSLAAVRRFSDYNGNVYDLPQVKAYGEDGRNFIRRTREKFDVIFLSLVMTNASQGTGYALSENYIYTVEAMQDYLDKLSEDGLIAFIAHDQNDLAKLVSTILMAFKGKGMDIKQATGHIALLTGYAHSSQHNGDTKTLHKPMIIIKKKPFSQVESKGLVEEALERGNVPLYMPYVYEAGPVQELKDGKITMDQYLNGFNTNVTPARDDRPYFYNFNKGVPPTLLFILLVIALGSVILLAPFIMQRGNMKPALYFSLLGIGFMMIEIPLIQRFILYLGHPVIAFAYVLAALLIGCGLGGFMSSMKLFNMKIRGIYIAPIIIALVNVILVFLVGAIFRYTSSWSIFNRIVLSSVLVMIQGFFMGMPFPRGLKLLNDGGKGDIIPVVWGINGVMSVIGSVLSIIISMNFGFSGALLFGGAIYVLVSLLNKL